MIDDSLLLARAQTYAQSRGILLQEEPRIGHGSDGSVWKTSRNSAVKAVANLPNYANELECYRRLRDAAVNHLHGFDIPVLEGFDDTLLIIEMTIVQPPYLLDFGKVYLDAPPPYWDDRKLRANAYQEWRERFDSRWEDVACVLGILEKYGIYYVDPRPGNIDVGE